MVTRDEVLDIGFKEVGHFTIMGALIFDLGRRKHLSLGSLGTPNEMLYICETDSKDPRVITDLICLHNYDYHGYITMDRIQDLIKALKIE